MERARLLLIWVSLALALANPPAAQCAGDNIFAGTQVHTVNISFSQPAWWDSLTIYYNAGDEQYMAATVTVDGVTYDSVGVRFKGNASYSHPNNKKPFRLSFDEYLPDQRWDGLKGVHLNNCWEDPTFIREKLHLDLCRDAGIPAPRGNFAELYLNGALWGFYSLVEHVDKTFLSARYGDNDGNLYKAVDGFLQPLISDFKWYGSDPSLYYNRYELKTEDSPDPWTDLIAVIDSLNNSPDTETALPPVVNLNSVYRAMATDIIMANLDSYSGSGRNFYAYFNPLTTKMEWIVWDAGMSMGSYWGTAQNYETLSLSYVISAANRPLAGRIHAIPSFESDYLHEACNIFTNHFSADLLFPQIDTIADLIRPYVYADPRKMYTNEQFEANIDSDITVGGHRKPGLKSFITLRQADVAAQLAALGVTCPEGIIPGDVVINEFAADNTLIADPAGEFEDWIEMYNNTEEAVSLDGMYLSDAPATPTKWQFPAGTSIGAHGYLIIWADDDAGQEGLHANFKLSASGEYVLFSNAEAARLDSVSFGAQVTNRTMARVPNGTGGFVQGLPTFNAYNGFGPGCVVINEFAADNTLIPDPAGEFEDWIELYNNLSESAVLDGMYLSDDPAVLTKWQFPAGTSMPAHSFLIVWADDDAGQEGLHASFKLSAGGEHVILSSTEPAVLDSVTYGQQATNLTMSRIPNGSGPFVQGAPTLNAPNVIWNVIEPGSVVINEFMADNDSIPDPAGEFEDWIELYNTTAAEINVGGLYMSDDASTPTKWQIPSGTTIAADGYLLIWADEDLEQAGLHAGFKLSAGGEAIVLVNTDLTVVDGLSFGPQETNLSMARIPNGSGPFVQTHSPTPGGPNIEDVNGVTEGLPARSTIDRNVPNPFHGGTRIDYAVARPGRVTLQVFDLQGRMVATVVDRLMVPGRYRADFEAAGMAAGVYVCRLRTPDEAATRKLLVVN